jgi:uncharacterized protein GlcG (DUF336 family)
MKTRITCPLFLGLVLGVGFAAQPAAAEGLMSTHRIPAALAAEAVATAVATCAGQGFPVSSAFLDADGVQQAFLRGDGAGIHTVEMSNDKAYTAVTFKTNTSAMVEAADKGSPPPAAVVKLPHLILAAGGVVIMGGADGKELLGSIAVSGVPNRQGDEVCAKAGLAKIADRLK